MNQPLISIITVVFNDVKSIEKTINSVINQTYKNIEFIIIDGGSTDGTVDIIRKYQSQIAFWISESDSGIYDAMNKGIQYANGDWVNFMNCGDWLYAPNTIELLFSNRDLSAYDVIYGDTEMRRGDKSKIHVPEVPEKFWKKLVVHQCLFSRRHINVKYPFDTTFKVSADFDFIYKIFFYKYKTLHLNIIVSSFDLVGYSHHNRYIGFSEDRKVALKYKGDIKVSLKVYLHYLRVTSLGRIIDVLKKYSPTIYTRMKKAKDNFES